MVIKYFFFLYLLKKSNFIYFFKDVDLLEFVVLEIMNNL